MTGAVEQKSVWTGGWAWITGHKAELRHSARVGMAGVLSFAVAQALHLPQAYWTVLTAIIVMQSSVGGSVKFAIERMMGTISGAVYGAVIASVMLNDHINIYVTLLAGILPPALLAAIKPAFRIAPVTVIIVLFSSTAQNMNIFAYALDRVLEIGLGSILGVAVSVLFIPARAHSLIAESAAGLLRLYAGVLVVLPHGTVGVDDRSIIMAHMDKIRSAQTRMDIIADEARRERQTYLTDESDPDPLLRVLRRLRHDLVMLSRAVTQALEPSAAARLEPMIADTFNAGQDFLRVAANAITERRDIDTAHDYETAMKAYNDELSKMRQDGLLRPLSIEAVQRLFTLGFFMGQFRQNLEDLSKVINGRS